MDTTASRSHLLNLVAACVVAFGLIAASLILAHRPPAVVVRAAASPALPVPPITQDSAGSQFRTLMLAAPALHTFRYSGTTYTLSDVQVTQVVYAPKDDNYTIVYNYVWQPAMPSGGPQSDSTTLSNDGFGHYYSPVSLPASIGPSSQNAYITIR